MNKYTSLKLSKLLHDNGCKLESEMTYNTDKAYINQKDMYMLEKKNSASVKAGYSTDMFPAHDILNDICVKYAKEFFEGTDMSGYNEPSFYPENYYPEQILRLLQDNEKQEAEDYIWEHCLFNPKNK